MSKEFQIRDGNLIASFDLENEDGDIDCCQLLKVSHGVADEIGMFVDYVATNKIIKDQSKQIADLEAKLAERCKEIAIRNKKLNELKNELHKRNESLERKKQQVEDVHKAVKQAKRESARKGRQVCYANNEVVQYQKQIRLLKQQLAEWERDSNATLNEYRAIKYENKQLNKALELAVQQLDDAKDMLRECGKRDWAGMLDTSVDYFKARAKEVKDE